VAADIAGDVRFDSARPMPILLTAEIRARIGNLKSFWRLCVRLSDPDGRGVATLKLNPNTTMSAETFHDLFIEELKDIYHAENQLLKALPKMAKAAADEKLKAGFLAHLEETKGHVDRLAQVFQSLGEPVKGKPCKAMKGLVEEGAEAIEENDKGIVRDVQLIGAAQRVEHYEIAAYGTVVAMAELMGHTAEAKLLQATLDEEGATDKKLTTLSKAINKAAFKEFPGM